MEGASPIIEMYTKDIEELSKLISLATRPNIKRQLEDYKSNLTTLLKEEEKKLEEAKKKESEKPSTNPTPENQKINIQFTSVTKYAFDTSNDKYIKLYLTDNFENIKTFKSENIKSIFTKSTFDICIMNWKDKNYRFSCFNLNKEIKPDDSYVKQTNSGLIVYLAKAKAGDYWDALEKKKSLFGDKDGENDPTKFDKNKDPNASLMEMMRDMYQNGDPEMKRMIAEAWTKSRDESDKKK